MPAIEDLVLEENTQSVANEQVPPALPEKRTVELPAFLRAKTGDGKIEDYQGHPLNFDGSLGLAQVIRGFTGMFDALDLAVIDVAVGFFRWRKGAGADV